MKRRIPFTYALFALLIAAAIVTACGGKLGFNDSMKWQIYEVGRIAACEEMPRILELVGALPPDGCEPVEWCLVEPTCYPPEIYLDESCEMGI